MPASDARRADAAAKRREAIALRLAGHDWQSIAEQVGYASRGAACAAVTDALRTHLAEEAAEVGVLRQQENERLDALLASIWPVATTPKPIRNREGDVVGEELDMRAVDTVLRLMDRRAKLNGLDMPAKAELTGAGGGPLQMSQATSAELEALIGIGPAPALPADDDTSPDSTGDDDQVDSGSD